MTVYILDILRVLIAGSKASADEKGAIDAPVTADDCLQRRNELVSNFIAGFVALLRKRDPEVHKKLFCAYIWLDNRRVCLWLFSLGTLGLKHV